MDGPLRNLLGIPREQALSGDALASCRGVAGNAYQAEIGTLQLLRGLTQGRTGCFLGSRAELLAAVAVQHPDLYPLATCAVSLRGRCRRESEKPEVRHLLERVPALGRMLLEQMADQGLPDPTFEGHGGPCYNPDGSVRTDGL